MATFYNTIDRVSASYGIKFDESELAAMDELAPPTPDLRKGKGYDDEEKRLLQEICGGSPLGVNWAELNQLRGKASPKPARLASPLACPAA